LSVVRISSRQPDSCEEKDLSPELSVWMAMDFRNTYEEPERASAYDELRFGGTYHLAFRDLPSLLSEHVEGKDALDRRRRLQDRQHYDHP
jgi:hypothetical protein